MKKNSFCLPSENFVQILPHLDPDPHSSKMLDPDPYPDPHTTSTVRYGSETLFRGH
jgi:hypothetical protein